MEDRVERAVGGEDAADRGRVAQVGARVGHPRVRLRVAEAVEADDAHVPVGEVAREDPAEVPGASGHQGVPHRHEPSPVGTNEMRPRENERHPGRGTVATFSLRPWS